MKRLILCLAVAGLVVLIMHRYAVRQAYLPALDGTVVIDPAKEYRVISVLDGDTFRAEVGLQRITVRLLGVDTPETVDPRRPEQCYGREASAEAHRLLDGRSVTLVSEPGRERRDRYGRYLMYAYVAPAATASSGEAAVTSALWRTTPPRSINEHLVREGYAREYTYGRPYSMQAALRRLMKEARSAGRGLWRACGVEM